jgi:hypothetical protein
MRTLRVAGSDRKKVRKVSLHFEKMAIDAMNITLFLGVFEFWSAYNSWTKTDAPSSLLPTDFGTDDNLPLKTVYTTYLLTLGLCRIMWWAAQSRDQRKNYVLWGTLCLVHLFEAWLWWSLALSNPLCFSIPHPTWADAPKLLLEVCIDFC